MSESKTEVTIETFTPSEGAYGKRFEKQTGNNLFQDVIAGPFTAAREMLKASGVRALTPSQRKRKTKNRAKRKALNRSR